jgi:hypothetical protein
MLRRRKEYVILRRVTRRARIYFCFDSIRNIFRILIWLNLPAFILIKMAVFRSSTFYLKFQLICWNWVGSFRSKHRISINSLLQGEICAQLRWLSLQLIDIAESQSSRRSNCNLLRLEGNIFNLLFFFFLLLFSKICLIDLTTGCYRPCINLWAG